ncbi:hypothetical protein L9F63_000277, partial [Diploptera punctata]
MDSSDDEGIIVKKKPLRKKLLDSDDENVDDNAQPNPALTSLKNDLYDTEESDSEKGKCSNSQDVSGTRTLTRIRMLDSDNEESQTGFNFLKIMISMMQKRKSTQFKFIKNSDLYDADESGDEGNDHQYGNLEDISEIRKAYKSSKKRSQSERQSKTKAVQQIHSETQRLVRESRVSLPYHRPRQRTLAEFLQRRQSLPSSVKLSKQLEERVKDAEQFYKSDSEEEGEEEEEKSRDAKTNNTTNNTDLQTVSNDIHEVTDKVNESINNLRELSCNNVNSGAEFVNNNLNNTPEVVNSDLNNLSEVVNSNLNNLAQVVKNFNNLAEFVNNNKTEEENVNSIVDQVENETNTQKATENSWDIAKMKPRLSGGPNEVIELDEDEHRGNKGVVQLMQRFIKHSVIKHPAKEKERVEIGVVHIDSEEIVQKDIVSVTLTGDDPEDDPKLAKPGAKLQKLKEQLQQQISKRRIEECSKRVQEKNEDNEELSDCGLFDNEDEMEEDVSTESETEEEEEEEEELPLVEKKRLKSAFTQEINHKLSDKSQSTTEEDSEHVLVLLGAEKTQRTELERIKTFDIFMTQEDDDIIPPYQRLPTQNQDTFIEHENRHLLELDSSASFIQTQHTQPEDMSGRNSVTKLLDKTDVIGTQENMDELVNLCSGQFSDNIKNLVDSQRQISQNDLESELVGLCSGKFSTQATNLTSGDLPNNVKDLKNFKDDIIHTSSGNEQIQLFSTQTQNISQYTSLDSGDLPKNIKDIMGSESHTASNSELIGL